MYPILKRSIKHLALLGTLCLCIACSNINIDDYRNTEPKLDLFTFFSGELSASGVVRNRSGKVIRHFNADIQAHINGDTLTLNEQFLFSDGEQQQRIWQITRQDKHHYQGTANDIEGTARGESAGQALRWQYKLNLESEGRQYSVNFDDWLFQTNSNTLINITDMSYFGFNVGEVVLVIQRH